MEYEEIDSPQIKRGPSLITMVAAIVLGVVFNLVVIGFLWCLPCILYHATREYLPLIIRSFATTALIVLLSIPGTVIGIASIARGVSENLENMADKLDADNFEREMADESSHLHTGLDR